MPSSDPNIFDKVQQAHRGFGDKGVEADSINFSQLKVKPFLEGVSKGNVFFSTSEAFELYKVLLEYANNKGQVTLSEKSLKITLKIIDDTSTLNVQAKVTEVKEGLHAVEFIKLSGDYFSFQDIVKTAKEFYGGHVNATI